MSEKIVGIDEQEFELRIKAGAKAFTGEDGTTIELLSIGESEAVLSVNGRRAVVPFLARGEEVHFVFNGETYRATVGDKLARKKGRHGGHSLSAPMPGVVLRIFVEKGQEVEKGTPLLILEAMKMEHQIASPHDGVVESISCSVGELVQPGIDLISVQPKEAK